METQDFEINTVFAQYEQKCVWYITNVGSIETLGTLYSPLFEFATLRFSWKYKIAVRYSDNLLTFELVPEEESSLEGYVNLDINIYNRHRKNVIETCKFDTNSYKSPSISYKVLTYDFIDIECFICYTIPESKITPDKTITTEIKTWDTTMKNHISQLYLNPKFSDITFYVEDSVFPAHRIVLATHSKVFSKMFANCMKERKEKKVYISHFTAETFNCMLCYIYTGVLTDLRSLINEVIFIAHMYNIEALLRRCTQFLISNMNLENVLDTLIIASQLNVTHLENACYRYIISNKKSIISKREFDDIKEHHSDIALKMLDMTVNELEELK